MFKLKRFPRFFAAHAAATALCILSLATSGSGAAQNASPPTAEKSPAKPSSASQEKSAEKIPAKLPAQIALLETHVRFEANGDSRKEIHALVKINDEAGARQFARLNFSYNRAFQSLEIPVARITHANGGTLDVLPSAITDNPDPAVVNFPAYHDIRVKSIRILGLEPDDTFEYRVVTTTTHHPLAPNFWFEHTFDRSGVVSKETLQVILPTSTISSAPIIIVKNESVRKQLEWRLYPDPGCGLCVQPDLNAEIDPSLLQLLPKKQKKTTPRSGSQPPAVIPPEEPLPPFERGKIQILLKPAVSHVSIENSGEPENAQISYAWQISAADPATAKDHPALEDVPDIEIGRNSQWPDLSYQLFQALALPPELPDQVVKLSQQLTATADKPIAKVEHIYDFVSQKIRTVDLPLGATGFRPRPLPEIISSGYATQEDKFFLFHALAKATGLDANAAFIGPAKKINALMAEPAAFVHLVVGTACNCWLDPALEVAPFGALPAAYRNASGLLLGIDDGPLTDAPASPMIFPIESELPFPSKQKVSIDATLDADGKLTAKPRYVMRGDNELLLRVAFHQSPKEKWNEVAQLLALSDGFRGKVTKTTASDPYETHDPFTVSYEITQPKFLDWSKKPLRIPALLPLLGLPDPPAKSASGAPPPPIKLGTPLEVEVTATLHLPEGTGAEVPAGTSVERDFATYNSHYTVSGATLTASRHINFILREIPADRAAEYNAFLHTVQNDESQFFTLERASTPSATSPKP